MYYNLPLAAQQCAVLLLKYVCLYSSLRLLNINSITTTRTDITLQHHYVQRDLTSHQQYALPHQTCRLLAEYMTMRRPSRCTAVRHVVGERRHRERKDPTNDNGRTWGSVNWYNPSQVNSISWHTTKMITRWLTVQWVDRSTQYRFRENHAVSAAGNHTENEHMA